MKKVFVIAATLIAATSVAYARGGGHGGGASGFSPGQSFQSGGPVAGTHGASGYSPGHQMKSQGSVSGHPGASGYAPGKFKH